MASLLNYPTGTLPDSQEKRIFRAFDKVLRADPILMPFVRSWGTWRGEDIDLIEVPSASMCPFLRLSPWPTQSDWVAEIEHSMPLTVRLELAVVGTNADPLMDFCGAVRSALFPQNQIERRNGVMNTLQTAGASKPTITLNAFGVVQDADQIPILMGQGTIQFTVLIFT